MNNIIDKELLSKIPYDVIIYKIFSFIDYELKGFGVKELYYLLIDKSGEIKLIEGNFHQLKKYL